MRLKTSLLLLLLLLVSCGEQERELLPAGISSAPLATNAGGSAPTLMTSLDSAETGIDFTNQLGQEFFIKYTYNGAGIAAGDYDGDGLADVYLVSEQGANKLYRSLGDMRFEDVTESAGLTDVTDEGGLSVGAHFADIDNDGDLDLFISNWRVSNRLYENQGDGTFEDITEKAGVGYAGGATTTTWSDYDRDGDLDFFVATYRPVAIEYENAQITIQQTADGTPVMPEEYQDRLIFVYGPDGQLMLRELGERDLFYRNNGDGTFEEVASQVGIEGGYYGLSAIFQDFDDDGWPDLYITNDLWSPDRLYRNQGDGTFLNIDNDYLQHTPWFSMGIDAADINNDGNLDYFIGDMVSRDHELRMTQHGEMDMSEPPEGSAPQVMRNGLYLNNGDGSFSDIAWQAGVALTDWTWTAKFADLDLDGFVDLLITNGMIRDLMDADSHEELLERSASLGREAAIEFLVTSYPELDNPNAVFRNNGDLTFDDVSDEWGFNTQAVGHGMALGDYDGDGDLDAVVNYLNNPVGVYRNNADNPRIAVRLVGQQSNQTGIGAKVLLRTNEGIQEREMTTSGGYLSGHEPLVVFGLGESSEIIGLRIEWPSGHVQEFPDDTLTSLQANQLYTITEPPDDIEPAPPTMIERTTQFVEVGESAGISWQHIDDDFDDFEEQPLLPRKMSTLSPGIAWGDANGDGFDDLYVAGGAGQTGILYLNDGEGNFTSQTPPTGQAPEEMAPLWWHNGGDTNPDLIVSYSSVAQDRPIAAQYEAGSLDRGDWREDWDGSGGAVVSADFDSDGDLDIFIGSRTKPNEWPLSTPSKLFANENGTLVDVTDAIAPDLNTLGLVTGAVWSDIDDDVDPDLIVATEWGAINVLVNDGGVLVNRTAEAGLAEWTGMWQGVVSADFDGDGDLDLAATNLGFNTPYTASPEHPTTLFAGDIDGTGDLDLVEAYYLGDTLMPFRHRGMVGAEMTFILNEFPTWAGYASATIDDVYGSRLDNVLRLEATTLAHTVFLNDGSGRFTAQPLPDSTQAMAGYGLTVADFDNDGIDDLYMVGNFSDADFEVVAYHGGTSYWLRGNGDGTFDVVSSAESGLLVTQDGRGVAVADYNQDGWADIAIGLNDDRPRLFQNQALGDNQSITIRLEGTSANPTAVGAKITINGAATREIQAGSGFLSQNSAVQVFGLGSDSSATITIRWPDGTVTEHSGNAGETLTLTIP